MTIYNRGGRTFIATFGPIPPNKPTSVPTGKEDEAKALIKRYPLELLDGGAADADLKLHKDKLAEKEAEIAALNAKLADYERKLKSLQQLATGGEAEAVAPARDGEGGNPPDDDSTEQQPIAAPAPAAKGKKK